MAVTIISSDPESGIIEARLELDAIPGPPGVALRSEVDSLELAPLLPEGGASGRLRLALDVHSRGAHLRELLEQMSGRIDVVAGEIRTGRRLLGPLGRDLFGIVFSKVEQQEQGHLRCGVVRADLKDGRGAIGVVLDTESATLGG